MKTRFWLGCINTSEELGESYFTNTHKSGMNGLHWKHTDIRAPSTPTIACYDHASYFRQRLWVAGKFNLFTQFHNQTQNYDGFTFSNLLCHSSPFQVKILAENFFQDSTPFGELLAYRFNLLRRGLASIINGLAWKYGGRVFRYTRI